MKKLDGVANFNNSEAMIDSLGDGRVNIGLYENKIIDGKEVRVLSDDIAPVNVWKNRILQNVPTFDVEAETSADVKNFGTRKDVLYEAATLSGAGSITELMGPDFLATNPDPTTQKIVSDINASIYAQADSYFANPYNLTSVLTQNTGKYSDESFTFNKDEADADENKILLKINPATQMGEMDDEGPNYKAQYDEAREWVKNNMLSKMDQERSIKTTSQNQLQETAEQIERAKNKYREKKTDDTPPVIINEPLTVVETNKRTGKKTITDVSTKIENLTWKEANGIENVVTDVGYNIKTGALIVKGYQVTGKAGTKEDQMVDSFDADGKKIETPKTVTQSVTGKKYFNKNDLQTGGMVTSAVIRMPNPERPGYNFSGVKEAKVYYKRLAEGQTGKKTIKFDAQGNIITE